MSVGTVAQTPRLVRCLDEPSNPIAACLYKSAQLASEHVKVALGGDDRHEIFAGFERSAAWRWLDRYGRIPKGVRETAT